MIDFDALVNTPVVGIFGTPALIQRVGFDDRTISGVFDSQHYDVADQGQVGGSTLITTFGFRVTDLDPAPLGLTELVPSDTMLTIKGVRYRMTDIRPDGEGWAEVQLERADA